MFLDFYSIVERNMLVAFRKMRLIQLYKVLIAQPLQFLFTDFTLWRSTISYKATITPQVCSLEMAAKKLLDADIEITELDGKPYDFLVTTYGTVDVTKLTALLKTYKLAGKSFIYVLGNTVYSCKFTAHVDEDIVELYSCKFIEHVDEDDGIVRIRLFIGKNSTTNNVIVEANASKAVASNVTISGNIVSDIQGAIRLWSRFTVTIISGETNSTDDVGIIEDDFLYPESVMVTPTNDSTYQYQYQ